MQKSQGLSRCLVPAGAANLQHLTAEPTQTATAHLHLCRGSMGTARSRDVNPSSPNNTPTHVLHISRQPAVALGRGDIVSDLCIFFPAFIASLKDKRENRGVEPFLVTSLDAVYKLTVLFLLWAGRGEPDPVCYSCSYF